MNQGPRVVALGISLVLLVPLAGCWGEDDRTTPVPELTAPTKGTEDGGWNQSARPERPKDVKSEQGLRAYVDYVVSVGPYSFASRDPSVLADLGDPATCVPCAQAKNLSEFYAQEVHLYEDRPTLRVLSLDTLPLADRFVVETEIHVPPSQRLDPRSGAARAEEPEKTYPVRFEVMWADGRWELINYGPSY
ncbi:hypothetical protein [Aeromicrobium duanguangcaii]|uniref:Lipoprotein n=1 Tax=Aeromicrobium duanguangcaii TaxID=2968086 RepID=A0ABY5KCI5_9ACTN|nr:hypothetical protein [Aeromicrobium duanguangcaii]MCD9155005.1 hypothetical protein [Aeromicrobium duanguangcaii]UUI67590.1 hypothetical protein NP095_10280 [Aeromicrobium duanguangcaii]